MSDAPSRRVPVRRMAGDSPGDDLDEVAVEEPLEIRVGFPEAGVEASSLVLTMRTPGNDAELACGFLFTEGLIDAAADVLGIAMPEDAGAAGNVVIVSVSAARRSRFDKAARSFYTNSSCGICGKASLEALRARVRLEVQGDELRMEAATLLRLPAALAARQPTFAATGALHAAALFDAEGRLLDVREDVGRHNAVDKLVGAALRAERLPFANLGMLVSGRASFEIVEKARMAGCPLLAAMGAPSSLAIDAAWESGITLVGFLRDGRFNVYATPGRVVHTLSRL
jgi:FdhD protein